MYDGCGREQGINKGAGACSGELSPNIGRCCVDAQDTVCKVLFRCVDPCGKTAGEDRVGAALLRGASPHFANGEDTEEDGLSARSLEKRGDALVGVGEPRF